MTSNRRTNHGDRNMPLVYRMRGLRRDLEAAGLPVETITVLDDERPTPPVVRRPTLAPSLPFFEDSDDAA
jgi:hypothetical protein